MIQAVISVGLNLGLGNQIFSIAAARILGQLTDLAIQEPPFSFFHVTPGAASCCYSPSLALHGDWPKLSPYMVPVSPGFMAQAETGNSNLTVNQGFRNADFFTPHRVLLRTWLADFLKIPHPCATAEVFLLESVMQARKSTNNHGFVQREAPIFSPEALLSRCRAIGVAPQQGTIVLNAKCAASADQYAEHFANVIVAGPLEQLHIALHARKLAAFLNNEHWWACFLTNAEETHVFYNPRRRGG